MATAEEIERRVEETDTARSERRSAAAKRVGELAKRRAAIAEQLTDIERELSDVLAESSDVIEINELARFTDVSAADLSRWLNDRKTARTKRKKPSGGSKSVTSQGPSTVAHQTVTPASSLHEPPSLRDSTVSAPTRAQGR
ncbi:hypothetical protein [Amycolatopsis pigmentata]|uniref:Uncharacterized protein n=1 Tax=Amycolatopsis pigmentata TaxID=450801 RepID=A0ABW5FLY0_9PSEU